jgi:hypothetical protein
LAQSLYFGDEAGGRIASFGGGLCGCINIGHDDPLK